MRDSLFDLKQLPSPFKIWSKRNRGPHCVDIKLKRKDGDDDRRGAVTAFLSLQEADMSLRQPTSTLDRYGHQRVGLTSPNRHMVSGFRSTSRGLAYSNVTLPDQLLGRTYQTDPLRLWINNKQVRQVNFRGDERAFCKKYKILCAHCIVCICNAFFFNFYYSYHFFSCVRLVCPNLVLEGHRPSCFRDFSAPSNLVWISGCFIGFCRTWRDNSMV